MRGNARSKGFHRLVAPVRPKQKGMYPLTSIDDYIRWTNEDGLPFDAWLRNQERVGAQILKPCREAMTIRRSCAEWETLTGLKFLQNGKYCLAGALNPMLMSVEKHKGVYIEPNVWLVHSLG